MTLTSEAILDLLRSIGEATRLRIVSLLQHGELTVSDLTEILGQSQPRISRHLKTLHEAGVVERHREGSWVFFDLVSHGPIGEMVGGILAAIDPHDPSTATDRDRLDLVRNRRSAAAQQHFAQIAPIWDQERSLHAPDELVEAAILDMLGEERHDTIVDLGTGTGRMLQLLDQRANGFERAVGLDYSHSMLAVARASLGRAEVHGVDLRQGNVYSPPLDADSFDLAILHQVLHYLDDPARAVIEAARLLKPEGRLLIVDFAPHQVETLRTEHAHRRLGIASESVRDWFGRCGLRLEKSSTVSARGDSQHSIDVSLWLGQDARSPKAPRSGGSPKYSHRGSVMTLRLSFEVFPPKTEAGLGGLRRALDQLSGASPGWVSVTYGAGGSSRERSFAAIAAVAASEIPVAAHLTCVDQPSDEIDQVLDRYEQLGVEQIVALRGDPPEGIDAPYRPHPDGYRSTADLVAAVAARGCFDIAVSAYPERHPQSPTDDHDLDVLAAKVEAGASRAITQMFFDNELFERYRDRVAARGIEVELIPGVFPIHSIGAVSRFAARCGASLPRTVSDQFASLDQDDHSAASELAADIAARQIDGLADLGVERVHLYTLNRSELALAVHQRLALPA